MVVTAAAKAWKDANAPTRASAVPRSALVNTMPTATAADWRTTSATAARRENTEEHEAAVTTNSVAIHVRYGSRNHTTSPSSSRARTAGRSASTVRATTSSAWRTNTTT